MNYQIAYLQMFINYVCDPLPYTSGISKYRRRLNGLTAGITAPNIQKSLQNVSAAYVPENDLKRLLDLACRNLYCKQIIVYIPAQFWRDTSTIHTDINANFGLDLGCGCIASAISILKMLIFMQNLTSADYVPKSLPDQFCIKPADSFCRQCPPIDHLSPIHRLYTAHHGTR